MPRLTSQTTWRLRPIDLLRQHCALYREEKNMVTGRLITAVPVNDETKAKMSQMVGQRTKANVEFQTEVNPDIIGGFILEYDTYRMDVSVKSQLRSILKHLN